MSPVFINAGLTEAGYSNTEPLECEVLPRLPIIPVPHLDPGKWTSLYSTRLMKGTCKR